jgi:hypothetical protein
VAITGCLKNGRDKASAHGGNDALASAIRIFNNGRWEDFWSVAKLPDDDVVLPESVLLSDL